MTRTIRDYIDIINEGIFNRKPQSLQTISGPVKVKIINGQKTSEKMLQNPELSSNGHLLVPILGRKMMASRSDDGDWVLHLDGEGGGYEEQPRKR
jgi:hypothetical protein